MRLWIALHLHQLVLDAVHSSRRPDTGPVVVCDADRVDAVNAVAARAGVQTGMRRGGALLLAPDCLVLDRNRMLEHAALERAALALLQYTPEVSLAAENTLLLHVTGSLLLFGGARALCRQTMRSVAALSVSARAGMAPVAHGAWAMARTPHARLRRRLRAVAMAACLDATPVTVLPALRLHAAWLDGIGSQRLGDLAMLPRPALQRRIGPEALHSVDLAYGRVLEAHTWYVPPPVFARTLELPDYLEHSSAVAAAADALIEQLAGWLTHGQCATRQLTLKLAHERGRHAVAPTVLSLSLAVAVWLPTHVQRVLREHLERLVLPAPVIALTLETDVVCARPQVSDRLFPEPGGTPADRLRLLDLLAARLGPEHIRRPAPQPDHRPEHASQWRSASASPGRGGDASIGSMGGGNAIEHPFWLLDPPRALTMQGDHPCHGSPLTLVRGPERIETGWWDGGLAVRDYFVAQDVHNVHYWIYRERDNELARWFLHGLFG